MSKKNFIKILLLLSIIVAQKTTSYSQTTAIELKDSVIISCEQLKLANLAFLKVDSQDKEISNLNDLTKEQEKLIQLFRLQLSNKITEIDYLNKQQAISNEIINSYKKERIKRMIIDGTIIGGLLTTTIYFIVKCNQK